VAYNGGAGSGLRLLVRGLSDLTKVKASQLAVVHEGDDAAVIKKIASAAGLGADIQGVDGTGEFFLQPNLTNAEVVNAIAKRNNYVVRVDDGKLVFSRMNKLGGAPKLKVKWSEVMEYGVEQSLDGVVTDVMVTGKDLKANKWLKGTAAAADVTGISGGSTATKLAKKAFGKIERSIDHTDDADQSQLVAMAKGELQRRAERFVRGEFTTTFLAEARTGAQLSFENPVCDAMKGPFIVKEVTHLFDADEGYRTRLSVISDSLPA
jgi:phage protein D